MATQRSVPCVEDITSFCVVCRVLTSGDSILVSISPGSPRSGTGGDVSIKDSSSDTVHTNRAKYKCNNKPSRVSFGGTFVSTFHVYRVVLQSIIITAEDYVETMQQTRQIHQLRRTSQS